MQGRLIITSNVLRRPDKGASSDSHRVKRGAGGGTTASPGLPPAGGDLLRSAGPPRSGRCSCLIFAPRLRPIPQPCQYAMGPRPRSHAGCRLSACVMAPALPASEHIGLALS